MGHEKQLPSRDPQTLEEVLAECDTKVYDQDQIAFPANALLGKDTGFQSYEPAGVITFQPQKSRVGNR